MPADDDLAARVTDLRQRVDAMRAEVRRWRPCRRCWSVLLPADGDDDHDGCEAPTRTPTATPRGVPGRRPAPWRPQ